MSSALILLLFLLLAAPALVAFRRSDVGLRTGAFYGLISILLLCWHVGFSVGSIPDAASLGRRPQGLVLEGSRCEQALATAERGRIILDRRDPNRLIVSAAPWQQIPEEVRAALIACAGNVRPAGTRDRPVEIVTR